MKKSLLILVLTVLVACSSTETAADEFTIIAEEWQGGNINEMIAVWGNPKVLKQASADGESSQSRDRWTVSGFILYRVQSCCGFVGH